MKTIPRFVANKNSICVQPKPAKTQARIPALQRIRILQKSALGKSQRAIAREEKINRESVGRIVRSEEAQAFASEMRAQFRGLCDLAMEALRQELRKHGKEAIEIAWRVLESNGIIPNLPSFRTSTSFPV